MYLFIFSALATRRKYWSSTLSSCVCVCVCLSAGNLGGEIQSCQRWSRCYSISSPQCSPTQQPTYSISALETTRSKLRFVSIMCLWVWGNEEGVESLDSKVNLNTDTRTHMHRKVRHQATICTPAEDCTELQGE